MRKRAPALIVAIAAFLAAALLAIRPARRVPGSTSSASAASAPDGPTVPEPPTHPLPAMAEVARVSVPARESAAASAPAAPERTGLVVLRGTIGVWGESKPFPAMRVRATDVETHEAVLEGGSTEEGTYVLLQEVPVSRAPFKLLVEAEAENLIPAIWSRAWIEVESVPFERQVFPLFLHRPIEIRGRVVELFGGQGIAGATVAQVWRDEGTRFSPGVRDGAIPSLRRAVTDPSGEFRALVSAALRRGNVIVEAEGYVASLVSWDGGFSSEPIEVALARADWLPRIRGRVFGADSRPAKGARLRAEFLGGKAMLAGPLAEALAAYGAYFYETGRDKTWTAVTDDEGRFAFQVPSLGEWGLLARIGESGLVKTTIEIAEAREVECEIRCPADAVVFAGTVRARRGGGPVQGAELFCEARSRSPGERFEWTSLRSDENGRFRVGPVPREPHRFSCRAKSYAPRSAEIPPAPDERETSFAVELEEECRLRGIAVGEDAHPLAGTRVSVGAANPYVGESCRADEKGAFELGGLPANVDLEFRASALRFPGGDTVRIDLKSDPLSVRFSAPGQEHDLGRVVLRPK